MKAMKKLILIFALIFISGVLATAQDSALWRYVNTLDGVNVRDKPSLNAKKKFTLKCNERVQLLEKSQEKETIGEFEEPWCKIRTQDGSWGFVYGAYLSSTLEYAAEFRVWEALHPVGEWFDKQTKQFSATMYLDSDMRNVTSFEDDDGSIVRGEGVNFLFFPTKNEETGKTGWYLVRADILDNTSLAPESLPIKIGDSIENVEEIFGEPNGAYYKEYERKVYEAFGTFTIVEMIFFHDDNGIIHRIRVQLSPQW